MQPRTGEVSAMSACRTTAWYQSGKLSSRVTVKARFIIGVRPFLRERGRHYWTENAPFAMFPRNDAWLSATGFLLSNRLAKAQFAGFGDDCAGTQRFERHVALGSAFLTPGEMNPRR